MTAIAIALLILAIAAIIAVGGILVVLWVRIYRAVYKRLTGKNSYD